MEDQVICLRQPKGQEPEFLVVVSGKVLSHVWPDKGSALAGLATEQRRLAGKNRETKPDRRAEETATLARHAAYVAEGKSVPTTCFPCPICYARAGEPHREA